MIDLNEKKFSENFLSHIFSGVFERTIFGGRNWRKKMENFWLWIFFDKCGNLWPYSAWETPLVYENSGLKLFEGKFTSISNYSGL